MQANDTGPLRPRRALVEPPEPRRFSVPVIAALVLLVALLVVGGYFGWTYWGANLLAERSAEQRVTQLRETWAAAPAPELAKGKAPVVDRPETHEVAWVLRIDRLGLEWPIVAGVNDKDLTTGVGWYPGSALPGQVGNFALAGPRLTAGAPFGQLLDLEVGDEVVIETATATFTYTITVPPSELTVQADQSWVLDPVPGDTEATPVNALITLTTSEDLIDTPDRAIGFGTLARTETP